MIPTVYKIIIKKPAGADPEAGFVFSGRPTNAIEKRGSIRWENMISTLQTVGFIDLVNLKAKQDEIAFDVVVDRGNSSLVGKVGDVDMEGEALIRSLVSTALSAPAKTYLHSSSPDALLVPQLVASADDLVDLTPISKYVPSEDEGEVVEEEIGYGGKPAQLVYDSSIELEVMLSAYVDNGEFHDRNYALPVGDTPKTISAISQSIGRTFSTNPAVASYEYTNIWIDSEFYIIPSNLTTGRFTYRRADDTVVFTVPDTYGAAFGANLCALVNVVYTDGRSEVVLQKLMAYGIGVPAEYIDYMQFISVVPVEGSAFTMIGEDQDYPLYDEYTYGVYMFDDDHSYDITTTIGEVVNIDLAQVQRYSFDVAGLEYSFTTDLPLNGLQLSQQGYLTGYQQGEAGVYNGTVTITLAERVFTYPIQISVV